MNDRICTLKIHSSTRDSPALRMGISQVLNSLQLRPAGMPPSAILIVDKVLETLPKSTANLYANVKEKKRWQSAINDQMDVLYKNAIRPNEGRVTGSAKALVFTDKAELIACLCRDVLEGRARSKWWWQRSYAGKFITKDLSKALTSCLVDDAKLLPMVMHLFVKWNHAIHLVSALDSSDATYLIEAVLNEYGCARLCQKISRASAVKEQQETQHTFKKAGPIENGVENSNAAGVRHLSDVNSAKNTTYSSHSYDRSRAKNSGTVPPWLTMFDGPVWHSGLTKQQAGLLGICRLAYSKSAILRNPIFEDQVAAWWLKCDTLIPQDTSNDDWANGVVDDGDMSRSESVSGMGGAVNPDEHHVVRALEKERGMAGPPLPSKETVNDTESRQAPVADEYAVAELSTESSVEADVEDRSNFREVESDSKSLSKAEVSSAVSEEKIAAIAESESRDAKHNLDENSDKFNYDEANSDTFVSDYFVSDDFVSDTFVSDAPTWSNEEHFDTQLGGCLYLINLLYQLELPECMGEGWGLHQHLSPWALLELVTRSLMADASKSYHSDLYWKMLAHLDNRRSDTPSEEHKIGNKLKVVPDYYLPVPCWEYLIRRRVIDQSPNDTVPKKEPVFWSIANDMLRIWSSDCVLVECCLAKSVQMQNAHHLEASELVIFAQEKIVKKYLRPYQNNIVELNLVKASFNDAPYETIDAFNARYIAPSLCRLASLLLPFLRRYLQMQLLLTGTTAEELVETLLLLPAQIYTSSTHIDLVGDINSSSLTIRCSGLDQDPGWLPLYGRVVLFHFS